jgi:hypothetical protein
VEGAGIEPAPSRLRAAGTATVLPFHSDVD